MLYSPTFIDKTGRFFDRNIDTVFCALDAGLFSKKEELGEQTYICLRDMSARMRAHFEADPEDETDDSLQGRELIDEMIDVLDKHNRASMQTAIYERD
jgi:hypothetical protein